MLYVMGSTQPIEICFRMYRWSRPVWSRLVPSDTHTAIKSVRDTTYPLRLTVSADYCVAQWICCIPNKSTTMVRQLDMLYTLTKRLLFALQNKPRTNLWGANTFTPS